MSMATMSMPALTNPPLPPPRDAAEPIDDDVLSAEAFFLVTSSPLEKLNFSKLLRLLEDAFGVSLKSRIQYINREISRLVQSLPGARANDYFDIRRPFLRKRKRRAGSDGSAEVRVVPSTALCSFLGLSQDQIVSRKDAFRRVWLYLKSEGLHGPRDPKMIRSGGKFAALLGAGGIGDTKEGVPVHRFSDLMEQHFSIVEPGGVRSGKAKLTKKASGAPPLTDAGSDASSMVKVEPKSFGAETLVNSESKKAPL